MSPLGNDRQYAMELQGKLFRIFAAKFGKNPRSWRKIYKLRPKKTKKPVENQLSKYYNIVSGIYLDTRKQI